AWTSPGATSRETPRNAVVEPNRLSMSFMRNRGGELDMRGLFPCYWNAALAGATSGITCSLSQQTCRARTRRHFVSRHRSASHEKPSEEGYAAFRTTAWRMPHDL